MHETNKRLQFCRLSNNKDKKLDAIEDHNSIKQTNISSRLIIKNLSGNGKKNKWDEAKIQNQFGKYGKITDVKLKISAKTGLCKFAFVGFEDSESCQNAIIMMNGKYVQGTKLQVEECKPLPEELKNITKDVTLKKLKNAQCTDTEVNSCVDKLIEQQILDTGRLFIRNLPYTCSEEKLTNVFKAFGPIAEIECIIDKTGQCKGYAFCTFMFPEHAFAAWQAMDGEIFMGRLIHIIPGKEKQKKVERLIDDPAALSSFQRDCIKNRKENAGKEQHTWNSLFLGANAVAEALAENYEVQKRDLLLEDGENSAAIRMAMAETRLVQETRKFLFANGVKLDAFAQPFKNRERSKTVIIVKNLSGKHDEIEKLQRHFSLYGEVKNVIMPPEHGITALVEMANEVDAKKAFSALSYSKNLSSEKGQPLYLEWAPKDVFDETHAIRSLNKYGYQNDKFDSDNVMSTIENINGDKLVKQKSENLCDAKKEEQENTKILVRNVPFQANVKEITQLFLAFGELKFVRMPKKRGADGHRGFCFVDFVSVGDACRAMESLVHSTHLYGRRLVLEWAKKEETIDELRIKRKAQPTIRKSAKKSKMRSFVN